MGFWLFTKKSFYQGSERDPERKIESLTWGHKCPHTVAVNAFANACGYDPTDSLKEKKKYANLSFQFNQCLFYILKIYFHSHNSGKVSYGHEDQGKIY